MKLKTMIKRGSAVALALVLGVAGIPAGFSGLTRVNAADAPITSNKVTYSFKSNSSKAVPEIGKVMDGTATDTSGIIYFANTLSNNGVTYEAACLRFRAGTILYLPIKDDTTKVKFEEVCNNTDSSRLTYIGEVNSPYKVSMSTSTQSVTVNDITGYIKEIGGQKYLPIVSSGDNKVTSFALTEYNPIVNVTVSGTIANAASNGITKITFKNLTDTNATDVTATVDADGKYSATLKRVGDTKYIASISNVGFKINTTDEANILMLTGNGETADKDFEVVADAVTSIAGTITGIPADGVKGELTAKLVPDDNMLAEVELALTKNSDGSYTYASVNVASSSNYSVVLTGADDYEVADKVNKVAGTHTNVEIKATKRATVQVSGTFVTSDKAASDVTKITFTSKENNAYAYTFEVTGAGYTAALRAGEYDTAVESAKYTAYDHVSVKTSNVTNNVYLTTPEDTSKVAYKETIKVGAGQEFATISEAIKYVARMERTADQRVTLDLTDALYREQLMINVPNLTISSKAGSTVTWYYGTGYSYNSVDENFYYSEARAVDNYDKVMDAETGKPVVIGMGTGHWGATVNVLPEATAFQSEGIIYENSFNRYMTTEEVADGVGEGGDNAKVNRSKATDADIKLYANKERACAIFIEADQTEFKDCQFLSSQDTMFTGNNTEHTYFKNCVIEGNTDYICGDGSAVFDQCTLSMYGYGDKAASGSIIVASKAVSQLGYIFNECRVQKTTYPGINTGITKTYFARPWRANSKVVFLNTEVQDANTIVAAGYTSMSGVTPAQAKYFEYNTHLSDGTKVSTSSRASGVTMMTQAQAEAIKLTDYFEGWNPVFYESKEADADYTNVDAAIAAANKLTATDYKDFSAVTAAVNAVVRGYKVSKQTEVEAMAKAITDAIGKLEKKEEPTTVAPTTQAPTTVAPTTQAPTTVAPTTEAPTTVAPTTEAPTTVAPTTEAPTIVAPTTEAPTTVAPTTVAPTVESTTVSGTTVAPTTAAATTVADASSQDGQGNSSSVNTGDNRNIMVFVMLIVMSLAGVIAAFAYKKKRA